MPIFARCLVGLLLATALAPVVAGGTGTGDRPAPAEYRVQVLDLQPLRLGVIATLPLAGDRLAMSTTRPGGIAQLDAGGWPALVGELRVTDADGHVIGATATGDDGWRLARPVNGRVIVHYEVDYASLAQLDWPAPRESAFVDAGNVVLAGRALFVTTPGQADSRVAFELPRGWHMATPWPRVDAGRDAGATAGAKTGAPRFRAETPDDLYDNLFALTRTPADVVDAGGLEVGIVAIGPWRAVRGDVRRLLEPIAARYVAMMPPAPGQSYLVVLLPLPENGGESFRNSLAMNLAEPPAPGNRLRWGNTLAHELFHYWNGWRLRGDDYAATQWFQEGFTEYVANRASLAAGVATPADFMDQLAGHVGNYRRLESTLAAPGTRKGPPLYSGGALVALSWDVMLRRASGGRRGLDEVFGALWQATGQGARPYGWADIQAALERTAPGAWQAYYQRHVAGREPLPVEATLQGLGLKLVGDGSEAQPLRVARDPAASSAAKAAWAAFITH